MNHVKIIECPRDAMQGIETFIPTETKVNYLNQLLHCNFDTLDFGSFVSPKTIPQLRDTDKVYDGLDLSNSKTKLLAIIANERGAEQAVNFEQINYLGYPFSISETFQLRNTNATIEESWNKLEKIQNLTVKHNKSLVVYLSMGFGNPYGDEWNSDIVMKWSERLHKELGINILALSDTIGCATPEVVSSLFADLIPALHEVEFGAHMHTTPDKVSALLQAAHASGCIRFDGAIKGFGGCPMAVDKLTGNMPTEVMLDWFEKNKIRTGIDKSQFQKGYEMSSEVF
ncbi:MAG: hydroxymethylglutaryl-CoA lyase [Crocinitomicaceae bacterium]|nr:hydroxymethylglutaryl-CoA lyase [Crocinitomicaceae bacterium]